MANSTFGFKLLLVIHLFSISCISAQKNERKVFVLKDSLMVARHEKRLPINIFQPDKWRFSIEDNPEFAQPHFDDSKWPVTNVVGFIDSLATQMRWNHFVWLRLTMEVDSTFFNYPWWVYYYSISPAEIYVDGKLIASFGKPATQKNNEIMPVFYGSEPQFRMLPVFNRKDSIVVAIRWSAHHTFAVTSLFPGTFKENGPLMVMQSTDPGPKWQQDLRQNYLRVFFGAGLLFLVIGIQGFSWWYTKSKLNKGIFFVSVFLLIHLFASHPYVFGYSLFGVVVDTLLFTPLFILLFLLFPWLAASMLNLPFQLSTKKYTLLILTVLLVALLLLLFKGAGYWGYLVILLGTIFISFVWLVWLIVKAYQQKIKYRGIVALTYLTPLGIVFFAFATQTIGLYMGFDLNSFLLKYNLLSLLIIIVYTSIPILTTFYIARQNIDLLGNLSFLVKERTNELEHSLNNLKTTQAQLIQSEKMASLGELTAGIAHEIQNPLNFVNNFSEVSNELLEEMKVEFKKGELDEGFAIADDIKQNLHKISHHGKRADAIVKGMLAHSKSGTGKKALTDINALAEEYLRLAYTGFQAKDKSFSATYKFEPYPNLPKLEVVPQDIGRVLLNLYNNAFYAVSEKQKSADVNYVPEVKVSTKQIFPLPGESRGAGGSAVSLSISDNGLGIPDSIKAKIFQPFFTTKPTGQGTGLGLSLSYDIVKAHRGELKVETKVGEGSEFIIQLPIS